MAQGKKLDPTDEDRKLVESMSGYGVPIEQIACLTCGGIDADTLRKHFKKELEQGKAKANSKIGQGLYQKAMNGDTAALIFWAKTQMRWKEAKDEPPPETKQEPLEIIVRRAKRDT